MDETTAVEEIGTEDTIEDTTADTTADIAEATLVEEVSIDGMCGVY